MNDSIVYTMYYNGILLGDQDSIYDNGTNKDVVTVFTAVKIPEQFDQDYMAYINEFELKIVAEALQFDNTGDNCFDAFANYWN